MKTKDEFSIIILYRRRGWNLIADRIADAFLSLTSITPLFQPAVQRKESNGEKASFLNRYSCYYGIVSFAFAC